MGNAGFQPPGGQWPSGRPPGPPTFQPVAPPPRALRPPHPARLPAILLIVAGMLAITSSFLTFTRTTTRLLSANSKFSGSNSRTDVVTVTGWWATSTVPMSHHAQPLAGEGLVLVSAIAILVAVLLLACPGRFAWTSPLAALASGLLAGVVLMSVLAFAEQMSFAFADKAESTDTSAGPAVWLQLPAGLLAVVVAVLAVSGHLRAPTVGEAPSRGAEPPRPPRG